jgi:predicted nuclease of predicted toxin-antitoxin system
MLKLYLNENLSWRIAKSLREYGYDVISSHEAEMDQADDPTQFAFAVKQGRAVVTNNFRDFVALDEEYTAKGKSHYGIIFTVKYSLPLLIRCLRTVVESVSQEHMMNQIRWLNEFEDINLVG